MNNVISAQDLKRRGIGAVDDALRDGPVHVIRRNRPSYVILSEDAYQRLVGQHKATERLWARLLAGQSGGGRGARDIDEQLDAERGSWESR